MDRIYSCMTYAIHGDANSGSRIGISSSYYLFRSVSCPFALSCSFQTGAFGTVLLNQSVWTYIHVKSLSIIH
jgi:hypothetical protein